MAFGNGSKMNVLKTTTPIAERFQECAEEVGSKGRGNEKEDVFGISLCNKDEKTDDSEHAIIDKNNTVGDNIDGSTQSKEQGNGMGIFPDECSVPYGDVLHDRDLHNCSDIGEMIGDAIDDPPIRRNSLEASSLNEAVALERKSDFRSNDRSANPQNIPSIACPICLSEIPFYAENDVRYENKLVQLDSFEGGTGEVNEEQLKRNQKHMPLSKKYSYTQHTALPQCKRSRNEAANENSEGISFFELSTCRHMFCAPCLRAYISSKLLDGVIDIRCCHVISPEEKMNTAFVDAPSKMISPQAQEKNQNVVGKNVTRVENDPFQTCNVSISELDIYRLIHLEAFKNKSFSDHWHYENDRDQTKFEECKQMNNDQGEISDDNYPKEINSHHQHPDSDNRSPKADSLWIRYEKLKFDQIHGKDSVRRCPNCDKEHLFDVESMKSHESLFSNGGNYPKIFQNRKSKHMSDIINDNQKPLTRLFNETRGRGRSASILSPEALDTPKDAAKILPNQNDAHKGLRFDNKSDRASALTEHRSKSIKISEKIADGLLENGDHPHTTLLESTLDMGKLAYVSEKNGSGLSGAGILECRESPLLNQTVPSLPKYIVPVIMCQKCSTEFCYFHSNAHPGENCAAYHRKSLELEYANLEYAKHTMHAKPCPSCGIAVSKEGGCNQIKCGHCSTHFCWLCGTIVDDGAFPEHFRWWNINGCPNMQLDESEEPWKCTLFAARILSVVQLIVLGIPALALAIFSAIFCPCMVMGCGRTNRERFVNCVSFWGSFLSTLLLLPFTCLGMLLMSALYMFVAGLLFVMKASTASNEPAGANESDKNTGDESAAAASSKSSSVGKSEVISRDNFVGSTEFDNIIERTEEGRAGLSPRLMQG